MAKGKWKGGKEPTLRVDARGAPPRGIEEFDTIPQVSCFGLRQKGGPPKGRSEQLRSDLSLKSAAAARPQRPQHLQQQDLQKAVKTSKKAAAPEKGEKRLKGRLCGASAILRSFSFIGPDMLTTDPSSLRRAVQGRPDAEGKAAAVSRQELASGQATILASYDNLMETKPDVFGREDGYERDGDRDDGADSLEEEDTFDVPSWNVDPHDIYFVSKGNGTGKVCRLGRGDFGPVYLGVWKDQEVAVKLARQKPISLKQERRFQRNVEELHSLHHGNIVQFLGACCWKGGKRSVLVTEYMDKSDLGSLLGRDELTEKFAWVRHGRSVSLDIARGLAYLHSQGVVHGRLKSSNVLLNRAGVAKISDPNLADLLSHCKDSREDRSLDGKPVATTAYLAPEILAGGEPTAKADIYAFGVILWELLSMCRPEGSLRSIRTPEEAPARIAYLVECCLAEDPSDRPSADQIVATVSTKQ